MQFIKLKGVSKEYKKQKVLSNVNLTVNDGDIFGVIGKSGSGKTTLLNLMAGFIRPTDGKVVYMSHVDHTEKDLHKHLHKVKKHIGFTPQHNSFYHKLTVEENLRHFGKLHSVPKKTLQTNIKSLLTFTQLGAQKDKLASHLSGGMQKRLDISCSLVHKPRILILDEPTADLDPVLQKEVTNLLQEANKQGITIVVASHHLDSIENICNKVVIVNEGKVHTCGDLDDVKKPYLRDHFTIKVTPGRSKDILVARLQALPVRRIVDHGNHLLIYPHQVEQTVNHLLSIIREENLYLHDLDVRKPSLQEVFETIAGAR